MELVNYHGSFGQKHLAVLHPLELLLSPESENNTPTRELADWTLWKGWKYWMLLKPKKHLRFEGKKKSIEQCVNIDECHMSMQKGLQK